VVGTPALDAALPRLCCPHCRADLARIDGSVVGCADGHRFDIARQGYLSLLGNRSRTDTGDTADMVAARVAFLGAGHYRPIADAVAAAADGGPVLEIGAGTGYYLAAVLHRLATGDATGGVCADSTAVGIAIDASRYAARRAATAHPRMASVVADAWSALPVRDDAVDTVLSVFAPRDPAEITRVLAPGGRLVVVTPEPEHLAEIRSSVPILAVDGGKPERLAAAFADQLQLSDRMTVRHEMRLVRDDVGALIRMGPSARHLAAETLTAALAGLPDATAVTLSVTVSVFRSARDGAMAARRE
jgi:23S rRNA (guanine745-N1)-methyltransferase